MLIDFPRPATVSVPASVRGPWVLAAVAFAGYALWSLEKQRLFATAGFDLGIFEQAVRSYAHGHWPTSDLLGPGAPTLGDHFHPILALLAPFYLLWPSPGCLLVAQAALLAVSAVPVTRTAIRVLGPRAGMVAGAGYVVSWGLLSGVNFDFHEVCFAVPLLAWTAERLGQGRWRAAAAWAAPLVLVKEDLPMTVAAVGVVLVLKGPKRLGWTLVVAGTALTAVLVLVVLPALNRAGVYPHGGAFANPLDGAGIKLAMLLALFAPTAFLALRSPIAVLLLPTLAWRLTSANPGYWGVGFHYSAVLMPVVVLAALDAARRCGPRWRRLLPAGLIVAGAWALPFQLAHLGGRWTPQQRADVEQVLDRIPDGAEVAASNVLAPHLTGRCRVFFFDRVPDAATRPEWVAVARPETDWPTTAAAKLAHADDLTRTGYHRVAGTDAIELLHRDGGSP